MWATTAADRVAARCPAGAEPYANAANGDEVRVLSGPPKVLAVVWSHDGNRLFTGYAEAIKVWEPEFGTEILTLQGPGAGLTWAADHRRLLSSGNGSRVWDVSGYGDAGRNDDRRNLPE